MLYKIIFVYIFVWITEMDTKMHACTCIHNRSNLRIIVQVQPINTFIVTIAVFLGA